MLKLKYADYPGTYHGFTLKEGFWYGTDTETSNPIAISGWESNGSVAIYSLIEGKWKMEWWDIEETDFVLENIPQINTEDKMSFVEWLEKEHGIDWNDYDNNYSELMARKIEEEYDSYYYDGLPKFVQKYL